MEAVEYEIPAPWGPIAAKLWGDATSPPILMVHGYMDNAASFDRLVPHLPSQYYYICIDLPGHGKSAHFPPYVPTYFIHFLTAIRVVLDHFDRKNYIILSHSYGAMISIMFSQVYPEYVTKLVMIDGLYLTPTYTLLAQKMIWYQHLGFANYIKAEMKGEQKGETYEQLLKKLVDNRAMGEISADGIRPIMERMLVPLGEGKFKFSLDPRLKTFNLPYMDYQRILEFLEECPVKCPTLVLLYDEIDAYKVHYSKLIQMFIKNPLFSVKFMEGNHHLHTVQPDKVAPVLSKFLVKEISKL